MTRIETLSNSQCGIAGARVCAAALPVPAVHHHLRPGVQAAHLPCAPAALAPSPFHACIDVKPGTLLRPRAEGMCLAVDSGKVMDVLQQRHLCLCCCAGPETVRAKVQALQPLSVRYGRPPQGFVPHAPISRQAVSSSS